MEYVFDNSGRDHAYIQVKDRKGVYTKPKIDVKEN